MTLSRRTLLASAASALALASWPRARPTVRNCSTASAKEVAGGTCTTFSRGTSFCEATALVQRHRAQGDRLLIVTATNEFVTAPIAKAFGIDTLIAVQLERDPNGELTGQIAGTPSFGPGKVVRLQQWLEQQGLTWEGIRSTFYSDSINDLPLLEAVTHATVTQGDVKLRAEAAKHGWPQIEWF